jgi:hypothetical protein
MSNKSIIQRLKDRLNRATEERQAKEAEEQPFKDRLKEIFTAPRSVVTDFYCSVCKRDCSGTGYRQVCTIRQWAPTAWYVGNCPKGHKMIRRITDKSSDPYYEMSPMIQRHRYEMRNAFMDPSDPRFKLLYPDKYEELMQNARQTTKN